MSRLSSPRFRRRLAWTAALAAVVAGLVAAVLALPGGRPQPETRLRPGGPTVAVAQRPLHVTRAMRRQIDVLVQRFVATAVTRQDPAAAWSLATAAMRGGVTRAQWDRGELPVFPYRAAALRAASWTLSRAFDDTVELEVLLQPNEGSGERRLIYYAALVRRDGRFLVDAFYPLSTVGEASAAAGSAASTSARETEAAPARRPGEGRLNGAWLLVPVGVLSLLLLAPLVLAARAIIRSRRAARRYREHHGV